MGTKGQILKPHAPNLAVGTMQSGRRCFNAGDTDPAFRTVESEPVFVGLETLQCCKVQFQCALHFISRRAGLIVVING